MDSKQRFPLLSTLLLVFFVLPGCDDSESSGSGSGSGQVELGDGGENGGGPGGEPNGPDGPEGPDGGPPPELELEPTSGLPGVWVKASGSDFLGSCAVELFWGSFEGAFLGLAQVENGTFSLRITVPGDALLGDHAVVARGLQGEETCDESSGEEARATFTVTVSQPPTGPFDFRVYLKNRIVSPPPEIDHDFLDEVRASERSATHALVQLKSLPRRFRRELVDGVLEDVPAGDIETLDRLGVKLLEYLNGVEGIGTTYVASIARDVDSLAPGFAERVRAVVRLEAEDKVEPGLEALGLPPEPLEILVLFFSDVTEEEAGTLFAAKGLSATLYARPSLFETTVLPDQIRALAEEDVVQWIERGPQPFLPTVNDVRAASNVDDVQALDEATGEFRGLSGAGVQIGIVDSGVDQEHDDFARRILRVELPTADHGTSVAGVAAGSGVQSDQSDDGGNPNEGGAFQWRGMAPGAGIAAYTRAGGGTTIYDDAINSIGVEVTNHSYVLQTQGLYFAEVASVDRILRGDIPGIPARPAVWAAGNNADLRGTGCGGDGRPQYPPGCPDSFQVGYFSVLGPSKNSICVASVNKETFGHSSFSSLGPTPDGRLKPEIAAVGNRITTVGGRVGADGEPATGNGYRLVEGTSMAAPAVAGIIALMLERYAEIHDVNLNATPPLPSTLKAILIQTATDLEGTDPTTNADTGKPVAYGAGPDWATGYGLVDAAAAIQLIEAGRFLEGTLSSSDCVNEFLVPVLPGQTEVRVTLAWDDVAGSVTSGETAPKLVNDLNLVLLEPDGTVHRPAVLPLLTPRDCDDDPTNGVQVGTCAGLDPSDQDYSGPVMEFTDRRNNVEQVSVHEAGGVAPGLWTARVSVLHDDGVSVRLPLGGGQRYSLAGVGDQRADIRVSKVAEPDPVVAGESLFYTVAVVNAGPDVASNVTVRDTLPPGLTFVVDTGNCTEDPPGTLTCELGDLAVADSREFTIKVAVDPDLVAEAGQPTTVANAIEVFSGTPDDNPTDNVFTTETIVLDEADLRVTKVCEPERNLPAGETATCTIFVDNLGPSTARNVRLTDTLLSDGEFTVASITSTHGACAEPVDRVSACNLGDLSPASPAESGRATVTMDITAVDTADISDLATVDSDTPDPDTSNNQAQDDVSVDAVADLAVTMSSAPDPVVAGEALTYTLSVTNNGPSEAVNVSVEDSLPAGLRIDSVRVSGGSCAAGVPGDPFRPTTCTLGNLAPSATETVTIATTVLPQTTGILHNEARVSSDVLDRDHSNDLAAANTAVEARADVAVTMTGFPDPIIAGEELTYEVSVANDGPSTALEIKLEHELPDPFSFVSARTAGGEETCVVVNVPPRTVSCELADLDPGETATVFVTVLVGLSTPDGSVWTSTATVSASTPDPDSANNSAATTSTVISQADLAVTMSDFPDPVVSGQELTYEVSVTNTGPSTAQDVRLRQALPDALRVLDHNISTGDGTCVRLNAPPETLVCELDDLDPGESFTVFVTVLVDPSTPDGTSLSSTATVSAPTTDPDESNDTATESTTVDTEADLQIELTSNRDTGNPSATFVYTVTVKNHGPSDARDVIVVDTLPLSPETRKVIYVFDSAGCAVDESTNVLTCEFGTLPAEDELSFEIHIQVRGSLGLITNTAEVTTGTRDPNAWNNSTTKDILVGGGAARGNRSR